MSTESLKQPEDQSNSRDRFLEALEKKKQKDNSGPQSAEMINPQKGFKAAGKSKKLFRRKSGSS